MDTTTPRNKRSRSISSSSSGSSHHSDQSKFPSPPPKYHRASPSSSSSTFICHLPPTCNQPNTASSHATQADLEKHQLQYHNYICRVPIRDHSITGYRPTTRAYQKEEEGRMPDGFVSGGGSKGRMKECGKVFPDERFLELHHTEVHDPIARQRQANGEKIFECFVPRPGCGKRFSTPANRRNHLQVKHHYPQSYFFSITNHGLNQIIQQEGLAASLIRPRKDPPQTAPAPQSEQAGPPRSSNSLNPPLNANSDSRELYVGQTKDPGDNAEVDIDMDDLAGKLESALAFVPPALRRKGGNTGR